VLRNCEVAFSCVLMERPSIWMAVGGMFHSSSKRAIQVASGVLPDWPASGLSPPLQRIRSAFPERYSRNAINRRFARVYQTCQLVAARRHVDRATQDHDGLSWGDI
jgi:hypothetical protein